MVNVILSLKHILQMYLEGGLVVAEYKTITKKELTELLDKYPEDEEFNIIQTQLGMTIIPLGGRIANKVDILEIANAAQGWKAYKMIKERRIKRRSIKNEIQILNIILDKKISDTVTNEILESMSKMDKRTYEPRVMNELFDL